MSDALKKGWTRVRFGDVVKLSGERSSNPEEDGFDRFVGLDHIDPGELRIRRWGEVADGTTFTSVFRPGQVLFGKRRAYQRKVAVADFSGVCSGDIYVLAPKNTRLMPELLPFICQTDGFFEHAVGTSAGSLSPRTSWKSLASYEFVLPLLEEQRQIADVLSSLQAQTNALTAALEAADALAGSLDETLAGRAVPHATPRLAEVISLSLDFRGRTPKKLGMHWGGDIPALSAMNVQMGRIDFSRETNFGSDALYKRWMTHGDLRVGDVLFTTEAPLGNVCLLRDDRRYILSQRVVALRADQSRIRPGFLASAMRSETFRREMLQRATGTTASGIRVASLLEIPICVPSLAVQDDAIRIVEQGQRTTAELEQRVAQAETLKATTMNRILRREI